jgi:hypothetical protein
VARNSDGDAVEGEIVEETTVLARRPASVAIQEWTPRFAISVDQAVEAVRQKREFMDRVMRKDEHYGVIPGTGDKPALLKPGAELLLSSMGLRPELVDGAAPTEDWTGERHGGEPFIQYRRACIIWRQTGPGPEDRVFIARAEGSCSSWEKKYRYRNLARVCPECGEAQIIKGKIEYGGGWLCWKKKGGCGAKFDEDDARITKQEVGVVANKDVADLANTILKMADKRAMVAATLVATGCSDIFTQDIEDGQDEADTSNGEGASRATKAAPTAAAPSASSEDVGRLIWLATSLPKPLPVMKDEAKILALLKTSEVDALLARVKNEHLAQCGIGCLHLEQGPA